MKIPSNIIQGNDFLFSHLSRFLAPVPGSHSNWKLCYRATSHGWAASTFHSFCDGKPHTVTIIRKSPYVFGGYTDIPWGKNIIQKCLIYLTLLKQKALRQRRAKSPYEAVHEPLKLYNKNKTKKWLSKMNLYTIKFSGDKENSYFTYFKYNVLNLKKKISH